MLSSNRCLATIAAIATIGSVGCATQSDRFRGMSAEDLERSAHLSASADDRAAAGDRLGAARRLREMEQAACAEVSDADRDQGPFARRDRIQDVELLRDRPYPKQMLQPAGVAIYLRASDGLTEQWLGHVLECHLAHHAVVGDHMAGRPSPLLVDDARVSLSSTVDGFRIAITAREVSAAREIIERAQALIE
ncbi:MAG TPA: hypothetical protein VEK07_09630 [Polyangiaceae bacterium]|nr:hypothetical protein [Polyangiaceae bacterium]